jgi:hypothetical protein
VLGITASWGKLVHGERGVVRAQYSYPQILFMFTKRSLKKPDYGVPVIYPWRMLPETAISIAQEYNVHPRILLMMDTFFLEFSKTFNLYTNPKWSVT